MFVVMLVELLHSAIRAVGSESDIYRLRDMLRNVELSNRRAGSMAERRAIFPGHQCRVNDDVTDRQGRVDNEISTWPISRQTESYDRKISCFRKATGGLTWRRSFGYLFIHPIARQLDGPIYVAAHIGPP